MKKLLRLVLTFALLLSLCACGGDDDGIVLTNPAGNGASLTAADDSNAAGNNAGDATDRQDPAPAVAAEPDGQDRDDSGAEDQPDTQSVPEEETPTESPAPPEQPESKPEPKPEPKPASAPAETTPAPQPQPEPEPEPAPAETPPAPAPEPEPEPEPEPVADPKATAESLVGHPVSELYAAIGYPLSSDYAPSCLDLEGEDGELVYSGFTVYTLRGEGYETVESVF